MLSAGAAAQPASSPTESLRQVQDAFTRGELQRAEAVVRTASARWSADAAWADRFRLEEARIALYQGNSTRVLQLLEMPVGNVIDADGVTKRDLYLSLAFARAGKVREARQHLAEAKSHARMSSMGPEIDFASGNLALELGDVSRALRLFGRALPLARQRNDRFLTMELLGNLGVVALRQERYEHAHAIFQEAGTIAEALEARQALEKYVGNAAAALYGAGDFERARALYRQAAVQAANLGAAVDLVQWRNNLGLCEWKLHRLPEALDAFESALHTAEEIGNEEEMADAHVSLGMLLAESKPLLAEQHAQAALAIAEQRGTPVMALPARMLLLCLEAEHAANGSPVQTNATAELRGLLQKPALTPSLRWQIEDELGRLAEAQGDRQRAETYFQNAIQTFQRQRSSLASVDYQLPFREAGGGLLNDYIDHLIAAGRVWEALRVLDSSRAHALEAQPQTVSNADYDRYGTTFARRAEGTALVYRLRPGKSYLWVIGIHGRAFYTLPGGEALRSLSARHQANILESRDLSGGYGDAGRALFQALVAPAAKLLQPGCGHLFLVVDGDLAQLNFETLLTGERSSHFWIEDVAITNARSLWQVARGTRYAAPARGGRLLLVSNDRAPGTSLPPLQHAREELLQVASHFPSADTTMLENAAATPRAYQASNPSRYRYLHFIAHGTADDLQPLQSAILLAGDPDRSHLYARDIMTQPLHAELVTLSSCFGSGSRSYAGEGTVGMAWAFQRAGAQHVIAALWQVSDASAPLLMSRLYEGLQKGLPPDQALREAKLTLLHQPGILRKPFYWAPLVLY